MAHLAGKGAKVCHHRECLRVAVLFLLCGLATAANGANEMNQAAAAVQEAVAKGDLARADTLLQRALSTYPNNVGLLNLRGVVHAQRGEFQAARQDFSRAVKADAEFIPGWQNLARACQAESDRDAKTIACAKNGWQQVLQRQPHDAEAEMGMAVAYQRSGEYSDSLQWLEKGPAEKDNRTASLMVRCLDLAGLKRVDEAKRAAAALAEQMDFREGDLQAMEAAGPAVIAMLAEGMDARHALQVDGMRREALAYEQLNRLGEARAALERVARAEPNNPEHLIELAHVAEKQLDHEGALGYLGHARELAPKRAQIHFLFGMVAAEMDLPMEARRSFDKALEIEPMNAEYNYAMGCVILTTRDAASAAGYFKKYIAARPNDASGHYALGVAEFTSGDYVAAKADLHIAERNAEVSGGAMFFLGRIARLEGDMETAKKYLLNAIALMPKFAEAHTEMARALMRENKLPEAEAELGRALELDTNSFQAHAQLAALYKRLHDPRADLETEKLKQLDEERTKRSELMLRGVEIRP